MEAPGIEDIKKLEEAKLTSAAAFVEGGIQDACDDACSICLEEFCESDPSTVTACKHEFHLQCILEWCQRSSQCPMCWQPISLKDPTSQELLNAVVEERNVRLNPPRNSTIFRHPTLGEFEIQHLPVGVNDSELEERIIQHLAAAAAMGRARHFSRREGHRNRSSAQGRPQFLLFSTHPNAQTSPASSLSAERGENGPNPAISVASPPSPLMLGGEQSSYSTPSPNQFSQPDIVSTSGLNVGTNQHGTPPQNRISPSQASPGNLDRAGPSDFQSFSETLKARLNAVSSRYKECISKSTRGWKERWLSRNSSVADIGSDARREVNSGVSTITHMVEHVEIRDSGRSSVDSAPRGSVGTSASGSVDQQRGEPSGESGETQAIEAGHPCDDNLMSRSVVASTASDSN